MINDPAEFHASISKLEEALAIDDKAAAQIHLRKLAEMGQSQRYVDIAVLYEVGNERLKPRLDLAFEWYSKSAYEEIDCDGYFGLARFYFSGKHVKKDMARSVELFCEAFNMGSVEAGVMLGYCYLNGFGVSKSLDEAEKYLSLPLKSGYVVAFYFLSRVEFARRHYFRALKLWWICISKARQLTMHDPGSPKLFYLHGAWKL